MTESANLNIDLNARNEYGHTAFHLACIFGRKDIVEIMIEHAESSKLNFKIKCDSGKTAIQIAESNEFHDVVDLIKRKLPAGTF